MWYLNARLRGIGNRTTRRATKIVAMVSWIWNFTGWQAAIFFLAVNILLVAASVLLWHARRWFSSAPRLFESAKPITRSDVLLTALATLINCAVGILGWYLWQHGVLTVPARPWYIALVEWIPLLIFMDFGMYVTHRMAHIRPIYLFMHQTHHGHHDVNTLSLFVLNPLEVLGFAGLMLLGIWLLQPSEWALVIYVILNVIFGTIGHTGVMPRFPKLATALLSRGVGTSLFHGQHHVDRGHNFGFYTTIWDRLFGTLHPEYDSRCSGMDRVQ